MYFAEREAESARQGPKRLQHITAYGQKLEPADAARANQARSLVKAGQFQEALGLFQRLEAEGALQDNCQLWLAHSCALHATGDAAGCERALATAAAYSSTPQALSVG